jgi:hypothetical protein
MASRRNLWFRAISSHHWYYYIRQIIHVHAQGSFCCLSAVARRNCGALSTRHPSLLPRAHRTAPASLTRTTSCPCSSNLAFSRFLLCSACPALLSTPLFHRSTCAQAWLHHTAALRSAWPQWPPTHPIPPSSRAGTTATSKTTTACSSKTRPYKLCRRACRCAPNPTQATTTGRSCSHQTTISPQTELSIPRNRRAFPYPRACRRRRCWVEPSRDSGRRSRRAKSRSTMTGETTSSYPTMRRAD